MTEMLFPKIMTGCVILAGAVMLGGGASEVISSGHDVVRSSVGVIAQSAGVPDVTAKEDAPAAPSSSINRLIDAKPELGAVLLVVGMFLAYLITESRERKKEAAQRSLDDKAAIASRETIADKCHGHNMKVSELQAESAKQFAVSAERLADAAEVCAGDRDRFACVIDDSNKQTQKLVALIEQNLAERRKDPGTIT